MTALFATDLVPPLRGSPEGESLYITQSAVDDQPEWLARSHRCSGGHARQPDAVSSAAARPRSLGHGDGYKYPHEFEGHYVPEDYLPERLAGARVYEPSTSGHEAEIAARLAAWAERRKRS